MPVMVAMDAGPRMESSGSAYVVALPATAEAVPEVRHRVVHVAQTLGADAVTSDAIGLAVSEACTNVVLHAYPETAGQLVVRARPDGAGVGVVVRDAGCGMHPRADSPGLGLGLPLMAQLSDRFEVRRGPDGRGTELRLWFAL